MSMSREYYRKNRTRLRAKAKARYYQDRQRQIDRSYWRNLRVNFGISREEFEAMFAAQDGRCAACREPLTFRAGKENANPGCVDHDHATGRVRSLLCRKCNTALGMLDENATKADLLADYIRRHQCVIS